MSTTFLVGVDGSDGSRRAALFAAERARGEGARLLLVHVVDWSPYEVLTPQELESRHVDRQREIDDSTREILGPLVEAVKQGGDLEVESLVRHGHAGEVICQLAKDRGVTQVFTGRRGRTKLGALLFGSVSGTLVQVCPVPLTVVP